MTPKLRIDDRHAAELLRHLASGTPPSKAKAREALAAALEDRQTLLDEIRRMQPAQAYYAGEF